MDDDRFFCHRGCCNLSKEACQKRRRRNRTRPKLQCNTGIPFPICEDCPQGEAIEAELEGRDQIVLPALGNPANEEAIRRLSIEAEEAGRSLPSLCLLRLCVDLYGRDPGYRKWIEERRDE